MAELSSSGRQSESLNGRDIHPRKPQVSDSTVENGHDKKPLNYDDENTDSIDEAWGDTPTDQRDMLRMGKKQEFKRNFSFLSALAFVSVYMATWEFVLVSLSVGFSNGAYGGLFLCFITTVLSYSTIVASLAEMASMAPTAGGISSRAQIVFAVALTSRRTIPLDVRVCTAAVSAK